MKHVRQPRHSKLCGQSCIAMITNTPLDKSIKLFGHTYGTKTQEVIEVLRLKGFFTGDKLIRMNKDTILPKLGILKMLFKGYRNSHWVVIYKGKIYDPAYYRPYTIKGFPSKYKGIAYISSYLIISHPRDL